MGQVRDLKYLLDSTLLIDHFNEVRPATDFLLGHAEDCAISVVTLAEVLTRPGETLSSLSQELLARLPVLPLDEADARLAAEFRHQYGLKLPDAFQAALTKRHGLRLVTRNTKDFDPKKHSFALIPYKL